MDFKTISEHMAAGAVVTREAFDRNIVVFLQIPASINKDIVPKMTSLSPQTKDFIMEHSQAINYHDQCIKYNKATSAATYFIPTIEDVYANDWIVVKQ